MKFDYEAEIVPDDEVIAVIKCGALAIRERSGQCIMMSVEESQPYLGARLFEEWASCGVTKKFYKGDSVTITF